MLALLNSLVPVLLLILAGWAARTTNYVEESHWLGLERVTYFIFFPALILATLAHPDLSRAPVAAFGGALVIAILTVAALLVALQPLLASRLKIDGPSFTSLFQGATRWNTFVALALAASMHGAAGVALMSVAVATMIPLLNVLAIAVLARYGSGRASGRQVWRSIGSNPFIWSSLAGIALNAWDVPVPAPAMRFVDALGAAALAAGLLVVGAGLDMRRLARPRTIHWLSVLAKMVMLPLISVAVARGFGVRDADLAVIVLATAVPTASGGYVLAKQMGGNAELMAEIITIQTILALLLMPVVVLLLSPA